MMKNSLKCLVIGFVLMFTGMATSWAGSTMHDHQAMSDHGNMKMHDHAAVSKRKMQPMSGDHDAHHADHAMSADEHAAHRAAMAKSSDFIVSMHNYAVPDVELIDNSGKRVALRTFLSGDYPVAVNFIFTTCTTICPVMTATFAQMRRALGSEADRIQLVSISIDPEHDTPAVLAAYAERFDAMSSNWRFLTGDVNDVERVLRTFDAWTGSKTNHSPITLMRRQGDNQWVRLEGLGSGTALAEQARTVIQ